MTKYQCNECQKPCMMEVTGGPLSPPVWNISYCPNTGCDVADFEEVDRFDIDIESVVNFDEIKVEYAGEIRTIGEMKNELKHGRATYHHWNAIIQEFMRSYKIYRTANPCGVLLPETPHLGEGRYDFWGVYSNISLGAYPQKPLLRMLKMYEFLLKDGGQPCQDM